MSEPVDLRHDGRQADEIRTCRIRKGFLETAPGSALIQMGKTRVLCGVTVAEQIPRWMRAQNIAGGWVTAEYSILPYATSHRTDRESSRGRVGGRTHEIQRLVGRCLRACVDLERLGPRTLWADCDVLDADGGTRMAAVTGAYVAMEMAVQNLLRNETIAENPITDQIAGISVGIVGNRPVVDLDYREDVAAAVDLNVVMTGAGRLVEIQGCAEGDPFSTRDLNRMLTLARSATSELMEAQSKAHRRRTA